MERKGLNQREIAEATGLTEARVSQIKKSIENRHKKPREEARENFPFPRIQEKFSRNSVYHRLADHMEYVATGGKDMSEHKLKALLGFYKRLDEHNVVVEFDPNNPPMPGIKYGGFAYVPREERDGDLIVRINEHTKITDRSNVWLRRPKKLPDV
ncbi:hypothetical protein FB471_4471 [Amycolatopsis cihanbeyliensis]|uniref:Uncharacterized protein n=2 Tax=Amycolatopsis cihanbeyliensis TaxID=1128664 RepID=A0A542DNK3_AMYCI|nr:hypothetical protein FB471_4471 [Amycolatopsis cihanbeyliensis]